MNVEKEVPKQISKKQYLGDGSLTGYIVPQGTERIGDWAFAHCRNLKWIAIPKTLTQIGKEIFMGCDRLETVWFYDESDQMESFRPETLTYRQQMIGELNAIALRYFKDPQSLIRAYHIGEQTVPPVWDAECKAYLSAPDETGFQPFLAGGEEDYEGGEEAVIQYRHRQRCRKAGILWKRLLTDRTGACFHDEGWHRFYLQKLRELPEALEVLAQTREHLQEAIAVSEEAKLLTGENIHTLLELIPAGNVELRAVILQKAGRETSGLWEL